MKGFSSNFDFSL